LVLESANMSIESPLAGLTPIVTAKTERQHNPGCVNLATNHILESHLTVRHASAIVQASIDKLGLLYAHLIHIFPDNWLEIRKIK
jgi:hypothetical protein